MYVFPEKELRGLSSNFHIHVSVSFLYVNSHDQSTYIFLQQNRQTDQGNIKITHSNVNVGIGFEAARFLFWEYFFFMKLNLQFKDIKN